MMEVSFQGIGEWAATFMGSDLTEGHVVKMSGSGTVAACGANEKFCGAVLKVGDGACAVQLGGLVTVGYSGSAPAVGYTMLAANGSGGVKTDSAGREMLVVAVDETKQTVTVKL